MYKKLYKIGIFTERMSLMLFSLTKRLKSRDGRVLIEHS
jgi:hypothetical protein